MLMKLPAHCRAEHVCVYTAAVPSSIVVENPKKPDVCLLLGISRLLASTVTRLLLSTCMSPVMPGAAPKAFCETAALVPGVRSCGLDTFATMLALPGTMLPDEFEVLFEVVVLEFVFVFVLELVFELFVLPEPISEEMRSLAAFEPAIGICAGSVER